MISYHSILICLPNLDPQTLSQPACDDDDDDYCLSDNFFINVILTVWYLVYEYNNEVMEQTEVRS